MTDRIGRLGKGLLIGIWKMQVGKVWCGYGLKRV